MPDEFISWNISSRVVIMEENSSECEGYGANLTKNNKENNLYHAIRSVNINEFGILSGCIYTDVNESRENLYLNLIPFIHNLSNDNVVED